MGKSGPTSNKSCSGALPRHIVHRVAMHVPLHGGVHFDAVVPKMAKQDFAFPASLRTTFLNWKVKPLDVAYERFRHKPYIFGECSCSYPPGADGSCSDGISGQQECGQCRLLTQTSQTLCDKNTYHFHNHDGNGLWGVHVTNGCQGDFCVAGAKVRCESKNFKPATCYAGGKKKK